MNIIFKYSNYVSGISLAAVAFRYTQIEERLAERVIF